MTACLLLLGAFASGQGFFSELNRPVDWLVPGTLVLSLQLAPLHGIFGQWPGPRAKPADTEKANYHVRLAEALSISRTASKEAPPFSVLLSCGFTPLHLEHYVAAHLQKAMPSRKVIVKTGLHDDIAGTLERYEEGGTESGIMALEWADLDPRLGYRHLGGWSHQTVKKIIECVEERLMRLEAAVRAVPWSWKLAMSLPTLPLPPAFHTASWQASRAEVILNELIAKFARRVVDCPSVLLVNKQTLDACSPPGSRYDFRSDLHTGFPYTLPHADVLAGALSGLMQSPEPKRGLITDLDDTLWSGLVGEVGHQNVSWDLAGKAQLHGLYQQMLNALAEQGVLIAVASKNSPEEVNRALARSDLVIASDKLFPVAVNWEAKSGSVSRILKAWNITADHVVFVDDSLAELEEVHAAHPGIDCIAFPNGDYAGGISFLNHLRDLFGKPVLSEEDGYRLRSIRHYEQFVATNGVEASAEQFLSRAEASIVLEYDPPASDRRLLDLVNKTNQFNLNGIRYTEANWQAALREPDSFAIAVSYQDRFGPLGKIALLRGWRQGTCLRIATWVMSCRAFSRRIEHQCLAHLFRRFAIETLVFEFRSTAKNRPLQDFLSGFLTESPACETSLGRDAFQARCPSLYHEVTEING